MKRIKVLLLLKLLFFSFSASTAQDKLTADTARTTLNWQGEKVTGQHSGSVKLQPGWIYLNDNKIVSGEFMVDMTSIKDDQRDARLERHLKSDDFFSVQKFPVAKLVLTGSNSFETGKAIVRGDLTIKGITNPVEFQTIMQKKDEGVWCFANITIDRTKYNVRYGSGSFFDNLGDKTIYDEFKLKVALLVKK